MKRLTALPVPVRFPPRLRDQKSLDAYAKASPENRANLRQHIDDLREYDREACRNLEEVRSYVKQLESTLAALGEVNA